MRRRTLLLAALALPGCILEAETCGEGFVLAGDRCVVEHEMPDEVTLVTEGWQAHAADLNPTLYVTDGSALVPGRVGQPLAGVDLDAVIVSGVGLEVYGAGLVTKTYGSLNDVRPPDQSAVVGAPDWAGGEDGVLWMGGTGVAEVYVYLPRALEPGDRITIVEADEAGGEGDFYSVKMCSAAAECVILGTGGPGPVTFELR